MRPRLLVIGLDCVSPELLFDRYRDGMPCVQNLIAKGMAGTLASTEPPITVPAWASMFSGQDPGELGLYGFHCREGTSYGSRLVSSADIQGPLVWDILGERGHATASLFVPPSWPALEVHRGIQVSCLLTPPQLDGWASPRELEVELTERFGPYEADIPEFRHEERSRALRSIYAMANQHFAIAAHVWRTRHPDLLVMVEIGPDRLHHLFWDRMDPAHPRYDRTEGDPGAEYYSFLDAKIAELVQTAGPETRVMIVSDHGAQPMHGGFHLNDWLRREGYLAVKSPGIGPESILWDRTRAWGEGGYVGRIYINVKGREPNGTVLPTELQALRDEITRKLLAVRGPSGETLVTRVKSPEELYRAQRGTPPDLQVFMDDLRYRCLGSETSGPLFSPQNDRGADACNHAKNGVLVLSGSGIASRPSLVSASIQDIAPTILGLFGCPAPTPMVGRDWSRA